MKSVQEAQGYLDKATLREYWLVFQLLAAIDNLMTEWSNEGMIIEQIVVQGPEKTGADYLLVIKGIDEARNRFVAFRSGPNLRQALDKVKSDAESGQLVFKAETPWGDSAGAKAAKKAEKG